MSQELPQAAPGKRNRKQTRRCRERRRAGRWALVLLLGGGIVVGLATMPVAARSLNPGSTEPARVRVGGALLDEVVRGLLPIDIVLPPGFGGSVDGGVPPSPTPMLLTELRYCGVTDKGYGRFRAVLRAPSLAGASTALLGGDEACRLGLADVTKQLAATVSASATTRTVASRDDIAVADIEAVWRSWEVRLAIVRFTGPGAGAGPGKPGDPRPLAAFESRRELPVISTSGIRIPTDSGETIIVHAALAFLPDAVELVVAVADNGGAPPNSRPSGGSPPPALGGRVNIAADIPHSFANQVLRQLTTSRALTVPVERDNIDVQNVNLSGVSNGLALIGLATPRSIGETARLTIHAGGEEARVLTIRADAQLESCSAMGTLAAIGCTTRNAGRNAAAAALGAALTQRYQGQVVRELAGAQTLRFEFGNRRLELHGELLHLASGGRALSMAGHFASGGTGH